LDNADDWDEGSEDIEMEEEFTWQEDDDKSEGTQGGNNRNNLATSGLGPSVPLTSMNHM
jgi:hypothetical protein